MKLFAIFFFIQLLSYFLLTCNFRAVAQGRYIWTITTDTIISALQFFLIKNIAETHDYFALAGIMCGGGIGSILGIWLTKKVFKDNTT